MARFIVGVMGKVLVTGDTPEHAKSLVDELLKEKYPWLRTDFYTPEEIQDILELEVKSLHYVS
jgi:hypothetical protein